MAHTSTAVVPSLSSLTALFTKVAAQYEKALTAKSVNFYPSQVTIASQEITGSVKSTTIPWTIRCVPALLDKAKEKASKNSDADVEDKRSEDAEKQNSDDVFAPPYHPDLLVQELPEHTVLLNKFCVVPKHFLLVTRDFQPQTMPPSPESLAIGYRILYAHQNLARQGSKDVESGKQLLAFYNCGPVSGASQHHQHIQFAELGGEGEVKASEGDRRAWCSIPIEELLTRIVKDGKEEESTHALPLPYQHFVGLLSRAEVDDDTKLSDYLGMKLLSLLDALFQARRSASSRTERKPSNHTSPSWNLLMTTKAMHLIPRQQEEFDGLRRIAKESSRKEEDGVELIGNLSINSLGYAGHLLVRSHDELQALQQLPGGMTEILRETGVAPVADVTTATGHS